MKEYGEFLENVDLKKYNTYGIGGHAKYLIKPDTIKHLQDLHPFSHPKMQFGRNWDPVTSLLLDIS